MTSGPFVALIETLLDWIGPFFSTYGYILIVAATMLEFGVRGRRRARRYHPGHRGCLRARGDLSLPWVIVLGALGTMAGESIGYWLGHRYGEALRRLPFADRAQDKIDRARESFSRNDSKVLLVGRFASGLRVIVPFTAGMSQTTSYRRFMAFVIPTAIVWAVEPARLPPRGERRAHRHDPLPLRLGRPRLGRPRGRRELPLAPRTQPPLLANVSAAKPSARRRGSAAGFRGPLRQ